ncbi:hypothetical protein BST61_g2380 [Cercospora zeina]
MRESIIQWPLGLGASDLVGAGVTAVVARLELRWVEQLFDAVQFIHSRNVLHGDISCNNIFLDDNLDVKLGDFAGSAIDDQPPLVCYETSHELPGEDISTMTELFALGSTVYEIMTGIKPYKELPEHEISAAFAEGRYPDLETVSVFRSTIMRCWSQSYATVDEALEDVKSEVATNKDLHVSLVHALFGRRFTLFPGLLTVVSLIPLVGWVWRCRSLQ